MGTWDFPEQLEAKRLLDAALEDGPAHAYLFHGPRGVGKREAARQFAAELLGGDPRVRRGAHPDLYVLEALGEMIRIDVIRELRRDLHMRPFEADRRVYLIFDANLLGQEAADALLKDLEEPPSYAVIVLVADDLGPLPDTIRSRCQLVPFTRLSERAVRDEISARAPALEPAEAASLARLAAGRLDRVARLLDPASAERREALLEVARAVYTDPAFEPGKAAQLVLDGARRRGAEAKQAAEVELALLDLTTREAEQRVRRAGRGAERDELLAGLEELESWYRDLVVVAIGAERAVAHADRLDVLAADGTTERLAGAQRACELVRETWRAFEEFNLSPALAFEALFVRLREELGGQVGASV
ncbi:MAG TPA: DNA polymerase III subunit [Gaiellaceae bacterium]|nr:DNA polymerase III subunit [Gaiellaceae bacterium]